MRFYFSNKLKGIAILLLLMPMCAFGQSATTGKDGNAQLRWSYTDSQIKISDDNLHLTLSIKPGERLKAQEVIFIYPQLVSKDGVQSVALNSIAIAGATRYKVMARRHALKNIKLTDPKYDRLYSYEEVEKTPLTIEQDIPTQEWMRHADLVIREHFYGCAECELALAKGVAAGIAVPVFGKEFYAYDFIQPEKVLKKYYETSCDCRIYFQAGYHEIDSWYKNNNKELRKLYQFVDESFRTIGAKLKKVTIRGYASPEGDAQFNKVLSQKRTNALYQHLLDRYPRFKESNNYQAVGMGEDWEGLKKALKGTTGYKNDEVIAIIDTYFSESKREAAIKNLDGGVTYAKLLRDIYPSLRRSAVTLEFEIRPYKDQELETVFKTNPNGLSHHELYTLAHQYEQKGEDPTEIYKMAHAMYSEDPIAKLNYANALLKYRKDATRALKMLESLKEDPRALYPMAIAYDMKGDKKETKELIKRAFDKGSAHARAFMEAENKEIINY